MKNIAIIQARMGSSRLPGKVLKDLQGRTVLERVVTAASHIPHIDKVIVATSVLSQDDDIEKWCNDNDIECSRGSEDNVLERFYEAATKAGCSETDTIMRLTADCPLLDPLVCGQVLDLLHRTGKDYANNIGQERLWPDGTDCEAFTFGALEKSYENADNQLHKEHVTLYIRQNPEQFEIITLACPMADIGKYRWTLDTPQDWEHLTHLLQEVQPKCGDKKYFSYKDFLDIEKYNDTSQLGAVNGLSKSEESLSHALQVIPDGTQTFSKSYKNHCHGVSPYFLDRGQGAYIWDIDNNCYLDYLAALLPVLLGHCDEDVNEAIKTQLSKGISFSLATELERELAEKLIRLIPSAEMVKFGKNGSDVTSAAIRLARAHTGRSNIAICGYHGWHDWYIGATDKKLGVPNETQSLSDKFSFNDISSLKKLLETKQYAAIILEPEGAEISNNNFLEDVRRCATEHGAILIFDEIVSGFRSSLGGIQELRGVVPDLSCFGKAMGNGMPISALVGKKDIMLTNEKIFFSGTFSGEALSLAAAIACIDKYERIGGASIINETGAHLTNNINAIFKDAGIDDILSIGGASWWPMLKIAHPHNNLVKKLVRQELYRNGIIQGSGINLMIAHADQAIKEQTLEIWQKVSDSMAQYLDNENTLDSYLIDKSNHEGFQVRG